MSALFLDDFFAPSIHAVDVQATFLALKIATLTVGLDVIFNCDGVWDCLAAVEWTFVVSLQLFDTVCAVMHASIFVIDCRCASVNSVLAVKFGFVEHVFHTFRALSFLEVL